MPNQYVNKVVINGQTKIDLTADTITAAKLLTGFTAHDKSGAPINGSCDYNANTSDATVSADELLSGQTAYGAAGTKVTGTMPNRGGVTGKITTKDGEYTIQQGYHDGSGKVSIDSTEQAKIIPTNIRQGVTVLGILGTMSGQEGVVARAATATPTFTAQTILPGEGYTHLSQCTVSPIPVSYTDNASGGQTCTVG